MVEGYDAADPERASILALREEWMDGGRNTQARIRSETRRRAVSAAARDGSTDQQFGSVLEFINLKRQAAGL